MVISTPAAGRLFDPQRPLDIQMREFIRVRFGRMLGDDVRLLDEPDGLDRLSEKYLALLTRLSTRWPSRS